MSDLLPQVRKGNIRAIARVITLIENNSEAAQEAISFLYPSTGNAHVVGVTGPPGSGKSTLVAGLANQFKKEGARIGIVAVDPSSPFSGGALLGDRVRMQDLAAQEGVFIRSMASRGNLGGLAQATMAAIQVLDAAGYDIVLVETVGAGQAEVEIAGTAHTILVIEAPGMGDEVQSIKAGILEIADDLVVNKADKPGALRTVKALEMMLHLGPNAPERHHGQLMAVDGGEKAADVGWQVKVFQTVASEGKGVPELAQRVHKHREFLKQSGQWADREKNRSRKEITQLLQRQFMTLFLGLVSSDDRDAFVDAVAERSLDPYSAADKLFEQVKTQISS